MKVGLVHTTTRQFVEKMGSLFPVDITVFGPKANSILGWCEEYRRDLDFNVDLRHVDYAKVDFSQFDLMIHTAETPLWDEGWKEHWTRIECPIVIKACWVRNPMDVLTPEYVEKVRHFPVLLEMPAHLDNWKRAGFTDVNLIYNPVGDWWFDRPWTGEDKHILFILAGTKAWRPDLDNLGWDIWQKLCERFPEHTFHHDGKEHYLSALEMAELFSKSRVFVNLDRPYGQGERPLTLAYTEALSAGMPVLTRHHQELSYHHFIDHNGLATNDFEAMCDFISRCLEDDDFAHKCSARSREIGRANFSTEALFPKYLAIFRRAIDTFMRLYG